MILVTGATGLLGTHVLVELSSRNKKIRALKRPNSNLDLTKKIFSHYFNESADSKFNEIEWVNGDVNDIVSLENAIKNCDEVYHCAALVSFKKSDFKKLIKINKEGTANVVNCCLTENIKHLVYVSSTAALGRSSNKKVYDETNKWVTSEENTGYAVSKYLAENEVWRGVEEGLNAVIVNPSVIIGPGNWNDSSVSIFKVVYKGLKFYTRGANAFVDARDVAYIMTELAEKNCYNEKFLVTGNNLPYRKLFEEIANHFKVKPPTVEAKPWMAAIVWRLEGILAFLFGKKQNITKETARSAMNTVEYSSEKIKQKLQFEFQPLDKSLNNAISFFRKEFIS